MSWLWSKKSSMLLMSIQIKLLMSMLKWISNTKGKYSPKIFKLPYYCKKIRNFYKWELETLITLMSILLSKILRHNQKQFILRENILKTLTQNYSIQKIHWFHKSHKEPLKIHWANKWDTDLFSLKTILHLRTHKKQWVF